MKKLTEQIILDFQQGDRDAFALVFRAYYPYIVLFAQKITGSRTAAEDIVTEAFVILSSRVKLFNTEAGLKAFLYITVRNRCLNYLQKEKKEMDVRREFFTRIQDDLLLEYEHSIKPALVDALHNAIEKLPEECRRIFKLLYFEGKKPAEIAALLQISLNTVYVQKARAIEKLRLQLK